MKSEKKEKEKAKPSYPCLMKSRNGTVVLFSDEGVGTVVDNSENSPHELGAYYKDFNMDIFEYYNGEITLKND